MNNQKKSKEKSGLAKFLTRRQFRYGGYSIVLTAIVITRSRVVGINCFGFGGDVTARAKTKDWMQFFTSR